MKVICIGRNYEEHARELKNEVPAEPVVFLKPQTALLLPGKDFYYPEFTKDLHYECELVYRICKNGKYIQEKFASGYYDKVTVGIDFTARDLQQRQKEKGLPWEIAKAFDGSAVIGRFQELEAGRKSLPFQFELQKNRLSVQQGDTAKMIFPVEKMIAYVSGFFTLNVGDLLFTGTPSGVGAVAINDHLEGYLEGEKLLDLCIL